MHGLNSIVRVPFTCVHRTLYGPLVLLPNLQGFSFFLKYPLLRDIVVLTTLLIFSIEFSLTSCSCLCMIVCQSAVKGILRNMSMLNVRLPGLIPRVDCIPAHMANIVVDKASLIYSVVLAMC
jgi:hypothetical protein